MALITVRGLPEKMKLPTFTYHLKRMLKGHIRNYWVEDIYNTNNTPLKSATISCETIDDAHTAVQIIDGHVGHMAAQCYHFSAEIGGNRAETQHPAQSKNHRANNDYARSDRMDMRVDRQRPRGKRNYHGDNEHSGREFKRGRDRSRSPQYGEEFSKLDMKIELLRKQRMIMEEERKLLLEKKKLEMAREYGPSSHSVESCEQYRDRYYRSDRQHKPLRKTPKQFYGGKLPSFRAPCQSIIKDMMGIITKHMVASDYDVELLLKLVRYNLRKRLAVALENKPYMLVEEIMKLYREIHPVDTDEALVKELMEDLEMGCLPKDNKNKKQTVKTTQIKETVTSNPKIDKNIEAKDTNIDKMSIDVARDDIKDQNVDTKKDIEKKIKTNEVVDDTQDPESVNEVSEQHKGVATVLNEDENDARKSKKTNDSSNQKMPESEDDEDIPDESKLVFDEANMEDWMDDGDTAEDSWTDLNEKEPETA